MLSSVLFIEDPPTHSVRGSFEKDQEHCLSSLQLGKVLLSNPWWLLYECWHSARRRCKLKAALSLVKIPFALKVLRNCYNVTFIRQPQTYRL